MNEMTVALYMRLSREDEKAALKGPIKEESNSISNQRKLLLGFLEKKQEFAGCKILQYVDDGYSGTGFERPGFVEMMKGVKKGKIQCMIVKDFSRFGRDYIELGDYIEHIFPFMQVRFISVNDGYDSRNYSGKTPDIDVPFRNLAYSLYSQDISDKVRSSLAVRRKKGLYIGSIPLYGYRRDEEGFLVPDEETKAVVQRIYRDYLSGARLVDIAGKLNEEGIPSPKQHKINKGLLRGEEGKSYSWLPTAIHQILQNETYIGTLHSGAYKNGPLGTGKRIFVPEEERIRVKNAHPPIIDKNTFYEVQEKIGTKRNGEAQQFLLRGLVRCGECGRITVRDKKRFRCCYQSFTVHRSVESFPEEELEGIVWKAVDIQLQLLEEREAVFQREKELWEGKRKPLFSEIKKKKVQAEKERQEIRQLYHKYRQGQMGKAEYLARKKWEGNLAEEIEKELTGLEAEEKELQKRIAQIDAGCTFMAEWLGYREDKQKLLQCMIESVYVYGGNKVEIVWRFRDKLEIE